MSNSFETEQEAPQMESVSNIAEDIVYRLPGCADLMVRKTIQRVFREFCRRSCCLHGRRRVRIERDRTEYAMYPVHPNASVESVTVEQRYRREFAVHGTVVVVPPWRAENCGARTHFEVEVVEVPNSGSEEAPEWFISKHGDDVASGVLAELMAMTGKAWSDPQQAAAERLKYENAVSLARMAYYAGNEFGSGDTGLGFDGNVII